jgi:hypothetical protein
VGVPLVEIIFIIWLRLSKGVCELARYTIREVGTIKDFDLSECQYHMPCVYALRLRTPHVEVDGCAYESEQLMMMSLLLLITMHEYGSFHH